MPRVFERFRLLKRIARGGMGEVYLATVAGIEGAERPVVIKTVRRDHDTDSSFLARFLDEARIQSQLHHPGVAQILEAATDSSGKPYVAVEYVEGKNLSELRARAAQLGVRIGWPEAIALSVTIGEALGHVHERNDADGRPLEIVHRDLSPQNVMVGYGGDVKLIDFGTARGENRRCHTISGVVFAKPGYVAPEVANNTPGGVPADLYAFGVILWELLSGRRFLVGEPAEHLAAVGAGNKPVPTIAQTVGAPADLDRVVARLTAMRIEDRYASARHATSDLVRILQRAPSLGDGDRSVRGRIAELMGRLYPAEPTRSRAEFQKLLGTARDGKRTPPPLPQSPPPPLASDNVLAGTRYRLESELGRGATGVVYEAIHLDLGRRVALKVLHQEYGGDAARERFVAEARSVARVSHENLVRLYELGFTSEGRPYYAMELVAGESLERRLAQAARLSIGEALRVGIGACRAVEAAHAAGLVHRDIKPGNLMLTADGTVKLLDFGVAKRENELEACAEREGEALVVTGTPEYMAPEQARGSADARSDVYALGVVLYELVTGALPHDAPSVVALIERKLAALPAPASTLAPAGAVPKALDRALERALAPEPKDRFQSAAAFAEALERAIAAPRRTGAMRRNAGFAVLGLATFAATAVLGATLSAGSTPAWAEHGRALSKFARSLTGAKQSPPASAVVRPEPVPAPAAPLDVARAEPRALPALSETNEASPATSPEANAAAPAASPEASPPDEALPTAASVESNPAARQALAEFEALLGRGRPLKAMHAIRHAADVFPRDAAILRAYAQAAQKSKAWGEARRAAARWVKVDPGSEARLTLARLERATGNVARAHVLLSALSKENPESQEIRRLLALCSGDQKLALNK